MLCCRYPSRMHDQSVVTDPFFLTRGLGAASPRRAARFSHSAPFGRTPWCSITSNRCNALPASADDRAIGDRVVQETLMQQFLEDRRAALWPLSLSAVTDQAAIGNLTD